MLSRGPSQPSRLSCYSPGTVPVRCQTPQDLGPVSFVKMSTELIHSEDESKVLYAVLHWNTHHFAIPLGGEICQVRPEDWFQRATVHVSSVKLIGLKFHRFRLWWYNAVVRLQEHVNVFQAIGMAHGENACPGGVLDLWVPAAPSMQYLSQTQNSSAVLQASVFANATYPSLAISNIS